MKNMNLESWNPIRNVAPAGVAAALLASALSACGSASNPTDVLAQNDSTGTTSACSVSGTYDIDGTCWEASSFSEACDLSGGDAVTADDGATVCRKTTTLANISGTPYASALSLSFSSSVFPRLSFTEGDVTGGYSTGVEVEAGDQVSYRIDAGWGEVTVSNRSWLGGILNWSTVTADCNDIDENGSGIGRDSDDNKQGLVASDGTKLYAMPSSGSSFTIENDGTLQLGFNVEDAGTYGNCGFMSVYKLQISHCEDESGAVHTCP